MAIQFESGFRTTVAAKVNPTDNTIKLATAPTVTSGRMFRRKGNKKEWIKFTGVSGTTLTGVTRGLSSTADPSTGGTGETWLAGEEIFLVKMHDQEYNRQKPAGRTYANTTARDADLGGDGVATEAYANVYTESEGLYRNYNLSSNQWESIDTGTVVANASETEAGKVEISTDAEFTAETDTGGIGAYLVAKISQLFKIFSFYSTLTSMAAADKIGFLDDTDGKMKIITKDNFRETISATTASKGTVELATDAEALAGTDETRYINSKQAKDNYQTIVDIVKGTRDVSTASGSVNYSHSLGVAPRAIMITAKMSDGSNNAIDYAESQGTWSNLNQECTYRNGGANITVANSLANEIIYIDISGGQSGTISAVSSTNFTIDWTKISTETGTLYFTATLFR